MNKAIPNELIAQTGSWIIALRDGRVRAALFLIASIGCSLTCGCLGPQQFGNDTRGSLRKIVEQIKQRSLIRVLTTFAHYEPSDGYFYVIDGTSVVVQGAGDFFGSLTRESPPDWKDEGVLGLGQCAQDERSPGAILKSFGPTSYCAAAWDDEARELLLVFPRRVEVWQVPQRGAKEPKKPVRQIELPRDVLDCACVYRPGSRTLYISGGYGEPRVSGGYFYTKRKVTASLFRDILAVDVTAGTTKVVGSLPFPLAKAGAVYLPETDGVLLFGGITSATDEPTEGISYSENPILFHPLQASVSVLTARGFKIKGTHILPIWDPKSSRVWLIGDFQVPMMNNPDAYNSVNQSLGVVHRMDFLSFDPLTSAVTDSGWSIPRVPYTFAGARSQTDGIIYVFAGSKIFRFNPLDALTP